MEYIAFQNDWSTDVSQTRTMPVHVVVASEDPTIDLDQLPVLKRAYPWMRFELVEQAGLALMFQQYRELIPGFASAAMQAKGA